MVIHPWRKILTKRSWVAGRGRDAGPSSAANGSRVLTGSVSSAIPPTLRSHNVATATANHNRAARWGSLIRVRCHCHPPRLVTLKPCSIQARKPYQHASPALGARCVHRERYAPILTEDPAGRGQLYPQRGESGR